MLEERLAHLFRDVEERIAGAHASRRARSLSRQARAGQFCGEVRILAETRRTAAVTDRRR
jgi:hypothetical protein